LGVSVTSQMLIEHIYLAPLPDMFFSSAADGEATVTAGHLWGPQPARPARGVLGRGLCCGSWRSRDDVRLWKSELWFQVCVCVHACVRASPSRIIFILSLPSQSVPCLPSTGSLQRDRDHPAKAPGHRAGGWPSRRHAGGVPAGSPCDHSCPVHPRRFDHW